MDDFVFPLPLALDVQSLTMSLVNIASPRGGEGLLADSIEVALGSLSHLQVERAGDTVVARTATGQAERVVVAAGLTTASSEPEPLAYVEMGKLFGPGASAAKGSLAMTLKAAAVGRYRCEVTFVYYADRPGGQWPRPIADELRAADFVLDAAPTNGAVRGGGFDQPYARRLIELSEVAPVPGDGDSFALGSLGVPTVAFGPGDPALAGAAGEFVPTAQLTQCEFVLRQWLTAQPDRSS
jgi:acetylornithine deacetylase/succinyl-diaminopimelate desuccinylase-like protein